MFVSNIVIMLLHDIRWESPSNCILAGPSFSGKSTILDKILRNKDTLFKRGIEKKVILFYLSEQPIYQTWERDNLLAYKSQGTPSIAKFLEGLQKFNVSFLFLVW